MLTDPRIVRLAGEAEEAAHRFNPFSGVFVSIVPERCEACLTIYVQGPVAAAPEGAETHAFCRLEDLDELLRELLVARADLVKLTGEE